ncbi:hypothetical protein DWU98_11175 [Dyella monticola]|uniref:PASTA domain-containing protein n=1 Tax=Dyella monticola TaxID=1927958 RepID=A0A370WYQ8_9GAMM|nr:hypothetical protein [Dyella monticola]RDS81105.1 hypothetical protein DWU98_11175 [Dyella monticola]
MNPLTFVVIRTMAVNQGIDTSDANRIGLVGSIPRSPIMGIVLGSAMISNDQPVPVAAAPAPIPTPTPTPSLTGIATSPSLPAPGTTSYLQVDKVIHLHTLTGAQVMKIAQDLGFQVVFDKEASEPHWVVEEQWPAAGHPVPQDKVIKVRLVPHAPTGKKSSS